MTGELLKRFNVFRSTDRARSQEQLSRSLCPHTLTMRGEEPIETVQSLAPLASSQLVYIEYSGPIAVSRARIDDYYLLLLPHRGPSEVTVDGRAVVLQPGRGTIIPAGRGFGVRCDQGVSALIWRIPREALEAQVDDRVRVYGHAIDFDLLLALDAGPGAALSRALHYAAAELDANGSLLGSARAMERFEQSLMLALIDCQMSEAGIPVDSSRSNPAPACVHRVEKFIHAHAGDEIAAAKLVAVSGVSARSLFRAFRNFRGTTPMEYLGNVRLRAVRRDLLHARADETVASIAARWGITQYGRMAASYRSKFGELPSETLRGGSSDR